MVSDALTKEMIDDGRDLLIKLDRHGPPVEAALWLLREGPGWKLVFSIRNYPTVGPRVFYKSVQRVFLKDPAPTALKLDDVSLAPPWDPTVAALRSMFGVKGIGHLRATNNFFNGVHISDALVYRTVN